MRLLPLLAFAQALGIWVADRGWLGLEVAVGLGASLLVIGLARATRATPRSALCAALAFLAGAASLAEQLDLAAARAPLPTEPVVVEATVIDRAAGPDWVRVDVGAARAVGAIAASLPTRIRLVGGSTPAGFRGLEAAQRGDRIRVMVVLHALHQPQNPGALSRVRRLERRGIGALGRLVHPALHVVLVDRSRASALRGIRALRREISARIARFGAGSALVRALALGDRSGLSSEVSDAFRKLGLSHLLAVSGLHLGLVASLAFAAARASVGRSAWLAARRDTRRIALGVGVAAAIAYALLSGWAIPVRRALVFLLVLALGIARGCSSRRAEPLAAAAIAVLAVEPGALFEPGAQLSFAATAALMFAAPRADRTEHSGARPRWWALDDAARASASAVAVTAPIAAWQLGSAAPFAWLANLVAIPWTAFALLPASLLAALALGCGLETLGGGLTSLAAWIARGTLDVALGCAERVPSWIPATRPSWVYVVAIALGTVGTLRARSTTARVLGALCVSVGVGIAPPRPLQPARPRAVAFEVGQGAASLVEGRRAAVLVDAAGAFEDYDWGRRVVVPALAALGVERLDLLIVSHADHDHAGGVSAVLDSLSIGEIWLPRGAARDPAFGSLRRLARSKGIAVSERGAGARAVAVGDLIVEPLWPAPGAVGRSRNDRSLVVRIRVSGHSVLLPGDLEVGAESDLVASGADLRSEVLALAHHGSRTSSSAAFLEAVGASVAIASAPCGGRFGMPHAEVLSRARRAGLPVWWTGRDGAVMIGLGERLTVWGYGERPSPTTCRVD